MPNPVGAGQSCLGTGKPCPPPIMNFNKQHRSCVVTLSAAKGLSRWAQRCFAALSMTVPALVVKIHYRPASSPIRPQHHNKEIHMSTHSCVLAPHLKHALSQGEGGKYGRMFPNL